ncbi:MAG: tRNA (adenosine(37)-N6)-threonylcarbamoyltransferase complex dimerization subunit type 1 TsaB [Gammaproteobacteria bacterium]
MKILAIDTATEFCSAALYLDGQIVTRELEFDRGHAEHILPMVDEVLAAAALSPHALDALAFGRGPGGFTGVRMAASVVQGLAFAWERVVVPVSDLAAVAQRALDLDAAGRVLVCNDARMQEVYWGCFERGSNGLAVLVGLEHVGPASAVTLPAAWDAPAGRVSRTGGGEGGLDDGAVGAQLGIVGVGRGFSAYPNLRVAVAPRVRVLDDRLLPRATEIAKLAVPEVQAGRVVTAEEAIPVYLRDDVARPQSRN